MTARPGAPAHWFKTTAPKQPAHVVRNIFHSPLATVVFGKEERVGARVGAIMHEPAPQLPGKIAVKWDPPKPALARSDTKTYLLRIEIAPPQAQCFTDAQTGTIEHQNKQPITSATAGRRVDLRSRGHDATDLIVGET